MKRSFVLLAFLILVLAGCTSLSTPKPYINISNQPKWWEKFNDPNLNSTEEIALMENSSLLAKLYNYEKAKLNVDLAQNSMLPNFSANINGNAYRDIDKSDTTTKSFSSNIKISYEADLFGKLKNAKSAKELEANATLQDYLSARLILSSEVANLYFKIAYINESIKLMRQNIAYQTKILDMTKIRFKAGAISKFDLITAEQSLSNLITTLYNLELEKKKTINSLLLALDMKSNTILDNMPNYLNVNNIPHIGQIPVSILSYRPDMIANELRLKEALVGVDIAKSNFYPSFSLTNSIGTSSNELLQILRNPVGSIGLNILLPFINYNEFVIRYKISKVDFEMAKANFRTTLFNAMKEINDILSANETYALKDQKLKEIVKNSQEMQKLSLIRYKAGFISMIDFLKVEQSNIQSRQNLLDNKYNMFISRIDLFKATGGK